MPLLFGAHPASDSDWPPVLIALVLFVLIGGAIVTFNFMRQARAAGATNPSQVSGSGMLDPLRRVAGDVLQSGWDRIQRLATIGPDHRRAHAFGAFGRGSAICFPVTALYGERYIRLGSETIIGPHATLSAGVSPDHVLDRATVVSIGDRCLIGRGSGIVAHESVEIGDDVFTGHHVYVTDANHGYADVDLPIGKQFAPPRPVSIGAGSWLGHGTIVLPGSTIGRHVVVGAGAVVTGDLPDFTVAVGNPARVIRRYVTGRGWIDVDIDSGVEAGDGQPPRAGEG